MRPLFIFIIIATAPSYLFAQDLTGVWQGHFRSTNTATRSSLFDDRYKFEVQIAQRDKGFEAVTYSYLSTVFYGKAAAAGTMNVHTGKVLLQEGKLLEVRNQSGDVCIMTCFLQYSKSGDEEFLEGSYVSMNVRDSSNCGRGTVFLRKVASSDFYEEPFLMKREKELAKKDSTRTPPAIARATPPANKGPLTKPVTPSSKTPPAKTGPTTAKTPPATGKAPPAVAKTPPPPAKGPAKKDSTTKIAGPVKTKPPVRKPPLAPTPPPPAIARVNTPKHDLPVAGDSSEGIGKKFPTIRPPILLNRANQLVRSLTVHTHEVTLQIYDDGAIDHDTVSVYLDNRQVITRAMLTDRPLTVTLHLDESNDYHEVVLVAENEGEIPPNTSLMIVKAGDKEYSVRISSSEQKNAVVTFKYEKL